MLSTGNVCTIVDPATICIRRTISNLVQHVIFTIWSGLVNGSSTPMQPVKSRTSKEVRLC
eukprot:jgi/Botrbrau1/2231/Bobra.101_2s0059.1